MPSNAEDPSQTSAEAFLEVLGTLTAESERRRAKTDRARARAWQVWLGVAIVGTVVFGVLSILVIAKVIHLQILHARVSGATSTPDSTSQMATISPPAIVATPVAKAPAAPVPIVGTTVTVRITAPRGPSWISARRGEPSGPVLYEGTLAQGGALRLTAPRVWIRFGALANLDLALNGRPVTLTHTGTVEAVFTASGVAGS